MIYNDTHYFIAYLFIHRKPRFVDKTPGNVYANNAVPTEESKMEQVYRRLNSDKFSLPKLESFSVFKDIISLKEKRDSYYH
jgi:hypothetical protein